MDPQLLAEEERIAHSGGLAALAGACARHPGRVILGWVSVFVLLIGLNVAFHGKLINDFKIPGSDTQKATDLINAKFGGQKGAALRVVLAAPDGERLDTPERLTALEKMLVASQASQRSLATDPNDISKITSPLTQGGTKQLSDSGQIGFFDVQYDRTGFELPRSGIVAVENQLRAIGEPAGIQVQFTGEAENAAPTQGISDILGLLAAFVILMVLFRALVPTVIPLLFAIVAVLGAFLLLFLAARVTHFNTVTEILVPMIGLGVGIDYTLFIVTRFRQFLHDGLSPQDAAAAAGATAGRAVIFAGVTVAISITGLALIGLDFITKLGIGSALGVLTAVLLANSLLPAVLSLLGPRINSGRLGLRPVDESREGQQRTPIAAWGRFVSRNAKVVLPVVCVVLLLLISPVFAVRLGLADAGTAPKDQTTRQAYDLLSKGFGPGFTEPIPIVVDMQSDHTVAKRLEAALRSTPGIAQVDAPIYNAKTPEKASVAIINTYGKFKPQDVQTDDLVSKLRHTVIPQTLEGSARARIRVRVERRLHRHRESDLLARSLVPALHHRGHVPSPHDGVPFCRRRGQGGADHTRLGARRLRRVDARRATRPRHPAHRPRPHRADRELRAPDRIRDPLRPVDGLRGVPDEPDPRGARARERHGQGSEGRRRRRRPGDRRRGVDHVVRLLLLPARAGPGVEGVRPAPRRRDLDRRISDAADARPGPPDAAA